MSALSQRHCRSIGKDEPALATDEVSSLLEQLVDWQLDDTGTQISRQFRFANYYETIAFVNAIAWVFHQQDHHPDLEVSYNRCTVHLTTHSVGGLSMNDFICAARLDELAKKKD